MINFQPDEIIGKVESVDSMVILCLVDDEAILSQLQMNQFVLIASMQPSEYSVGMVTQITKQLIDPSSHDPSRQNFINRVKILLVGTYEQGQHQTSFKRTIVTLPNVNAICYRLIEANLNNFMISLSSGSAATSQPLSLGHYALSPHTSAILDGNRLFQRHAVIVGSTGSGKSWTVAKLLEQVANLPGANALVIDIHGEYGSLEHAHIRKLRIAGPLDTPTLSTLFVPYWFLNYEEMLGIILQQKEAAAQNQVAIFNKLIIDGKRELLERLRKVEYLEGLNVETPVPFDLEDLIHKLDELDQEMVDGQRGEKKGKFHGNFTKVIERLRIRVHNKRYNFMFGDHGAIRHMDYFNQFVETLMKPGIKVIDFSEVPSDLLPLVISMVNRIVFTVQQWVEYGKRNPIAIFCDEAHLYMSEQMDEAMDSMSLQNFLRIAKEGRKYGVSLVTITQRPSEVSRTILSQSGNFIVMKLTNSEDQNVVRRLVPDSFGSLLDQLPILDVGECIVLGDASLLPMKIKINAPKLKPNSATMNFWNIWSNPSKSEEKTLHRAIVSMRKQSKI